jgi:hypothetical protein
MLYIYYRVVETWHPMRRLDAPYYPMLEGVYIISEEPLFFSHRDPRPSECEWIVLLS